MTPLIYLIIVLVILIIGYNIIFKNRIQLQAFENKSQEQAAYSRINFNSAVGLLITTAIALLGGEGYLGHQVLGQTAGQAKAIKKVKETKGENVKAVVVNSKIDYDPVGPTVIENNKASLYGTDTIHDEIFSLISQMADLTDINAFKDPTKLGLLLIPYTLDEGLSKDHFDKFKSEQYTEYQELFTRYQVTYPNAKEQEFEIYCINEHFLGHGSVALRLTYNDTIVRDNYYPLGSSTKIRTSFNYGKLCPPGCDVID